MLIVLLVIAVICVLVEIFTNNIFTLITFIATIPGMVIALIVGLYADSSSNFYLLNGVETQVLTPAANGGIFAGQVILMVATWLFLFFTLYNWIKRRLHGKLVDFDDLLIGQEAILQVATSNVNGDPKVGKIKIQDKTYNVLPYNSEIKIEQGHRIVIRKIEGTTLLIDVVR